ncbi:hypothetical protein C922_05060 [Plasmodium inui San Antonio 1]|uniref:Uncharacterized protein n=1 Tax=Plasmodium inui San Antonio 1 TaxID=1237626 RepID=W7A654_9APIC|nr:hypothetical protein C922_05060 [Plasmodium inui San Antonio 1]EUD64544.1 hypothetical protein C922_05060 [Plasmodium inui San Antonio 1]
MQQREFCNAAYAYYDIILHPIKNSFIPPYTKERTITQMEYRKRFIFENMILLCFEISSLLKLNNLYMIYEHRRIKTIKR